MNCKWEDTGERDDRGWRRVRCVRCGLTTNPTPHSFDKIHSQCRVWGLGDYAAYGLMHVGITSERVSWLLKKPCHCGERQEAANEAGWRVWKWLKGLRG